MKKLLVLIVLIFVSVSAMAVEQCYMPNGYVRDDTIYPYYAALLNEYFKKVDNGEIECNWRTYRQYVQGPLSKITDKLFDDSRREIAPMPK